MLRHQIEPLNRSKQRDTRVFYLSACVIVKDEAAYILEWISYHRIVGFEFFYIYDNDSTDGLQALLTPLVAAGVCEVINWPRSEHPNNPQVEAYHHCIWTYGHETEWLAIVDADEFVVPRTSASVPETLEKHFSDRAAVVINWRIFGSSGHRRFTGDLCIERFMRASGDRFVVNKNCKSIFRPKKLEILYIHNHQVEDDNVARSDGSLFDAPRAQWTDLPIFGHFQINHYYCKSFDEFLAKRLKGLADHPLNAPHAMREMHVFREHDRNEILDTNILRFLHATKVDMMRLSRLQ